eukprot:911355_1
MYTLKEYQKFIVNKNVFYNILGFLITPPMIDCIKNHEVLYDEVDSDELGPHNNTVITRLVQELGVKDELLVDKDRVLSATVDCVHHELPHCLEMKFNPHAQEEHKYNDHEDVFRSSEYKMTLKAPTSTNNSHTNPIHFTYDVDSAFLSMEQFINDSEYSIYIKNADFFGTDKYILCNVIQILFDPNASRPFYD